MEEKNNRAINNVLIKHLVLNFFFFHLKFPDVEDIEKQMPGLLKVHKCVKKHHFVANGSTKQSNITEGTEM